jgi:hypothetical protein
MALPDTELTSAAQLAEAAREAVVQLKIPHERSRVGPMSVSAVASRRLAESRHQRSAADCGSRSNLVSGKNQARNRIVSMRAGPDTTFYIGIDSSDLRHTDAEPA